MAATSLGTTGVFGLTAQTGIILQSQDDEFMPEKKICVDATGEKVGIVLYGDQRTTTLTGLVPTSSAFSSRLAAAITLANSPGDFYRTTPSAGYGDVVLTGVKRSSHNEDFHSFSLDMWSSDAFNIA